MKINEIQDYIKEHGVLIIDDSDGLTLSACMDCNAITPNAMHVTNPNDEYGVITVDKGNKFSRQRLKEKFEVTCYWDDYSLPIDKHKELYDRLNIVIAKRELLGG